MVELRMTSTTGANAVLEEATVETLKSDLRGELLHRGDAGYDDARKVWNGMIDRKPGLIICCTGAADVITAVKFARTNDLLVDLPPGTVPLLMLVQPPFSAYLEAQATTAS